MSDTNRKFLLRLSSEEYDKLKEIAWKNKTSMNQWIRDQITKVDLDLPTEWVPVARPKQTPEELNERFALVDAEPVELEPAVEPEFFFVETEIGVLPNDDPALLPPESEPEAEDPEVIVVEVDPVYEPVEPVAPDDDATLIKWSN